MDEHLIEYSFLEELTLTPYPFKEGIRMLKDRNPALLANSHFKNPFGDEVAQEAEVIETNAIADENGNLLWLRRVSVPPPVFGRS